MKRVKLNIRGNGVVSVDGKVILASEQGMRQLRIAKRVKEITRNRKKAEQLARVIGKRDARLHNMLKASLEESSVILGLGIKSWPPETFVVHADNLTLDGASLVPNEATFKEQYLGNFNGTLAGPDKYAAEYAARGRQDKGWFDKVADRINKFFLRRKSHRRKIA